MKKDRFKPGGLAPESGQYQNTKTKTEITATKNKPLPPTPEPWQNYVLIDKTKHKKKP